jgi:hypothetical protein
MYPRAYLHPPAPLGQDTCPSTKALRKQRVLHPVVPNETNRQPLPHLLGTTSGKLAHTSEKNAETHLEDVAFGIQEFAACLRGRQAGIQVSMPFFQCQVKILEGTFVNEDLFRTLGNLGKAKKTDIVLSPFLVADRIPITMFM